MTPDDWNANQEAINERWYAVRDKLSTLGIKGSAHHIGHISLEQWEALVAGTNITYRLVREVGGREMVFCRGALDYCRDELFQAAAYTPLYGKRETGEAYPVSWYIETVASTERVLTRELQDTSGIEAGKRAAGLPLQELRREEKCECDAGNNVPHSHSREGAQ